jgi:hypothetical protein
LIFIGNKARRQLHKESAGANPEGHEAGDANNSTAQEEADASQIAICGFVEHLVEATKKLAENPSDFLTGTQQHGAQRRREGESDNDRENHRYRYGDGELPVQLADDAAHERDGHKHGAQHEPDRDDGPADLFHSFFGCLQRTEAVLYVVLDGFNYDNGIVHDNTDSKHHGEHC